MPAAVKVSLGTQFGRLTVIEATRTPSGRRAMRCRCACGTEKVVDLGHLRTGHTTSCGCWRSENSAKMAATNPLIAEHRKSELRREQLRQSAFRHGYSRHPHGKRWRATMARCYEPGSASYRNYGGRGISVCAEWHDLVTFCQWVDEHLGERPAGWSFDRIDNDGNYEPGNVRWADPMTQTTNRRPRSMWVSVGRPKKVRLDGAA